MHYDRWWNPAVGNQVTDRDFHIGQTRNVRCDGLCQPRGKIKEAARRSRMVNHAPPTLMLATGGQ